MNTDAANVYQFTYTTYIRLTLLPFGFILITFNE